MTQPATAPLDQNRLVAAAFRQLEDDGLDGLSMRRVAARLGVQAPALYWHVRNKAELLGLMAGEIYAVAHAEVGPNAEWTEWLRLYGRALRLSFASHRDGARLCAAASPPPASDAAEQAGRLSRPLTRLGLAENYALACQAAVISFTLGWESYEANGPMRDFLREMMDFEATFETGLDALVRGLEANVA